MTPRIHRPLFHIALQVSEERLAAEEWGGFCSDLITKREALLEESRGPTILWKFQKGSECIYMNEQGEGCRSPKKLEEFSLTPVMDWRANCQTRKRTFDGDELLQKSVT